MATAEVLLHQLQERFVDLHRIKEDLFWETKMGLAGDGADAGRRMAEAEIAHNRFLQDPARLATLRGWASDPAVPDDRRRLLDGWVATFAAHVIEDAEARRLSEELVEREAELERRRQAMPLGYTDPGTGAHMPASSVQLALMTRTDPDPDRRRAAYRGLESIEPFVLEHGFLPIVRLRNRLARRLGHEDFYAWRLAVVERMSKAHLFALLEDLAARTTDRAEAELDRLVARHGDGARQPWSFAFLRAADVTGPLDPCFPLEHALERWCRSFHGLGIGYRGATLTLDLLDRPGKYDNGFMHAPEPAFYDRGHWRPARVNLTANAVVGQTGSGLRATETLFHEGGHAAHFANIVADAPCFSHELAPTSVAHCETQAMFLDSLLGDAAWRARYAMDRDGRPMSKELIEHDVAEQQPFRAWDVRAMLTVPFAERALYEIPDDELHPERVRTELRRVERRLQGLSAGLRPTLAVPHLLASDSSAYGHGYVLAWMAAEQTRRFFLGRDGHLVDNPRVGRDLSEHCWKPGNAVAFEATLRGLIGAGLSADALIDRCNQDTDASIAEARRAVERLATVAPAPPASGVALDARVRVAHGADTVCEATDGTFDWACEAFAAWIRAQRRAS